MASIRETIKVVKQFRYLGGQIFSTEKMRTDVLKKRFARATAVAYKLLHINISTEKKLEVIEAKVLAMALYGTELANPPEESLKKLAAAIVTVIAGKGKERRVVLTYETNKINGRDVDPVSLIHRHRFLQLRRFLERKPEWEPLADEVIRMYGKKEKKERYRGMEDILAIRRRTQIR